MTNPIANFKIERAKDKAAMENPLNVQDAFKSLSLEECKNHCATDRLPFDACFLNITSDLNVSTSIRTLHLLGVDTVFIVGKHKLDRRALVGAEHYTHIEKCGELDPITLEINPNIFQELLKKHNYCPIFVETGGESLENINWNTTLNKPEGKLRPLLIFGNEGRGISQNILNLIPSIPNSLIVSIPMKGVLRSLNVSASVAIVTWDLVSNYQF